MTSNTMATLLAVSISAVVALGAPGCTRLEPGPRVMLVTIDTLRADRVGAWGYQGGYGTPNLDKLSNSGVRFEWAHSTMPTTDPSHASILTGLYPRNHGLRINAGRAVNGLATLALWMRDHDMATGAITARLGLDPPRRNLAGFDSSDSPQREQHWRSCGEVVELTGRWLDEKGHEPWFLWVHLWEPHKPYEPPAALRAGIMSERDRLPSRYSDSPRFLRAATLLPAEQVKASRNLYDGEISAVDNALGLLLDLAREWSLRGEAPLLIVASDHGESLAERQASTRIGFGHGTLLYQEALRVPLIIHWQGRLEPQVITTPVSMVDLAPTVAGLLDPEKPFTAQGRDLSPWLRARVQPPPKTFYAERRPFGQPPLERLAGSEEAWIDFPWKLILAQHRDDELYRLDLDPGERKNLAAHYPARLADLRSALETWKQANPPARARRGASSPSERAALKALGYLD